MQELTHSCKFNLECLVNITELFILTLKLDVLLVGREKFFTYPGTGVTSYEENRKIFWNLHFRVISFIFSNLKFYKEESVRHRAAWF